MNKTLIVPSELLGRAAAFLETCGSRGLEGTAMIIGGDTPRLIIPAQTARRSRAGVAVQVTPAGQMQLATALGQDETYAARIHSHPDEAFHSASDDANPVLTYVGALSVVVPFFGLGLRHGLSACAIYRREAHGWRDLPYGDERDRWITHKEAPNV